MIAILDLASAIGWGLLLTVLLVGLAFLYHWLGSAVPAFLRFRGARVVTCPENGKPAGVAVDAVHAAATAFRPRPELQLATCSRWPEKQGCGQECLSQIEARPEDCLVRTVLTRWYAGKTCVLCGTPFGAIHWHDHKPALLGPDDRTFEWQEIPAEQVPDALAHDEPVCWNCHIAETFRREHPDLVADRPWQGPDRHHRML